MFDWKDAKAEPFKDIQLEADSRELVQANWVLGAVNCVVIGRVGSERKQYQFSWDFAQGFQILGGETNTLGILKLNIFPTRQILWKIERSPIIRQWAQNEPIFEAWEDDTNHWVVFTEEAIVHVIAVGEPTILEQL